MAAHQAGVRAGISYLERFAAVRRGRNGVEKAAANGLVVVGFDHRTSRAGDPLLHTHAVVMNRAQGPDGRWTAPDGRPILAELRAADAVYRAVYQRELTRLLGVEWTGPGGEGNRELEGIPAGLLRDFSKARCRIEEQLAAREAEGLPVTAEVRNILAHTLREAKTHEALPTLRSRWAGEAARRGWDIRTLCDRLRGQARTVDQLGPDDAAVVFEQLAGPQGLTEHTSTFTRGEVLRGIANQPQATTLPVTELEALADRFLSERAVAKLVDVRTGAQRFSVPELLELERSIVEQALARQGEARHVLPGGTLRAVGEHFAALGKPLGVDQAEVVARCVPTGRGCRWW